VDQIDLTGPFEVLSRIPNATYRIYGKTAEPVRDLKGLRLTPDAALQNAPPLDVLHVPGGFGQDILGVHRRPALWRSRPAQGAPGDDAFEAIGSRHHHAAGGDRPACGA
jgi:cyclohexyl-isocyanide hydratase